MAFCILSFIQIMNAQICAGVTALAFPLNPQAENFSYYGVRVGLEHFYTQDVTVVGGIQANDGEPAFLWSLTIPAGSLTAETSATYFRTTYGAEVTVDIQSVDPCPEPTPVDISYLMPKQSETITTQNQLYVNFVSSTGIFQTYPNLQITDQNLELLTLQDTSIKAFIASVSGVGTPNKLAVVYNDSISEYMYYFIERSQGSPILGKVFDETNTLLYETTQTSTAFSLSFAFFAPKSCFAGCMEAQEDYFEDTIAGWIYWNLNPWVQVVTAVNCQGCCKKWWKNGGCVGTVKS